MASAGVTTITPAGPDSGIRFTVASRPQRRFSATQTVSNLVANSFQPISLPATGFVRKVSMFFQCVSTSASAGALVAGDAPFNLISGITLSDATGQPIYQPISGYNLFLLNKWLPAGTATTHDPIFKTDPELGPEYAYATTATTGTATFRLELSLEQDSSTGYGCIPNLDANASLQLKIDLAAVTVAFTGTTQSASTMSVRVTQWYWAPVGATTGGVPNSTAPTGFGDFLETRYETQTVTASAENTVSVTNRGGLIKGIIAVSRAAGTRVAFTAATNVGTIYDNNAIDEGVTLEEHQDLLRKNYGYIGTAHGVSNYPPLAAGTLPGLDAGVLIWPFCDYSMGGGRDTWLSTRVGTLLQLKVTPGAAATQLELITQLMQVKDAAAFYEKW